MYKPVWSVSEQTTRWKYKCLDTLIFKTNSNKTSKAKDIYIHMYIEFKIRKIKKSLHLKNSMVVKLNKYQRIMNPNNSNKLVIVL